MHVLTKKFFCMVILYVYYLVFCFKFIIKPDQVCKAITNETSLQFWYNDKFSSLYFTLIDRKPISFIILSMEGDTTNSTRNSFYTYKEFLVICTKKNVQLSQLLRFVKYAITILLVSSTTFLVGVTSQVHVITIKIVTPTKKVVVLTNKIAVVYITNRSSWFY